MCDMSVIHYLTVLERHLGALLIIDSLTDLRPGDVHTLLHISSLANLKYLLNIPHPWIVNLFPTLEVTSVQGLTVSLKQKTLSGIIDTT